MKKTASLLIALILLISSLTICIFADGEQPTPTDVYVTIASPDGALALAYEKISVKDTDGDNVLTINDALHCAHDAKYTGGAEAGYGWYNSDYGVSMSKLWGDTSGNFGYYLNNTPAMSLTDTIKKDDHVYALVFRGMYPDMESFSYFDVEKVSKEKGDTLTLTLYSVGYDAEWKPVSTPVEGATLSVNGQPTEFKTGADGKVTLTLDRTGELIVSAACDTTPIAPPVCIVSVYSNVPAEADTFAPENESTTTDTTTYTSEEKSSGCKSALCFSTVCMLCTTVGVATVASHRKKDDKK